MNICYIHDSMKDVVKKIQQLENELARFKEKLKAEQNKNLFINAILEGGALIIWAIDTECNLTSFNQNYFNYFLQDNLSQKIGYEKNGVIKTSGAKPFWNSKYKKALAGHAHNFEILMDIRGQEKWKDVFLNPIYDLTGKITGVSGLAYDITEKMQTKIGLIKSEEKFRNIFESFQDLYFRCDLNGNLTMLSPSVEDIAGYSEEELIGKNITNFYIYNIRTKHLLDQLTQYKRVRNFEAAIIHKSGKIIHCICNVRVIQDNKGRLQHIEGVARDISELKKTTEQLQISKELAEKSLKVKERFLANMSHEIRTPLNGIMGMLHLLDDTDLNPKQRQHVKVLKSSSEILLNILDDLLDLSKIEAGKMSLNNSPVKIKSLFHKLFLLYKQQAKDSRIKLRFTYDPELPDFIETDEIKLIQVYSNLITNALKFTPENGQVAVGLSLVKTGKADKNLVLKATVTDNGIGISDTDQKKLFSSFTQLDSSSRKSYKGTGLGLHISKKLVKLFKGKIGVESKVGEGSTFWFTFEANYAEPVQKPAARMQKQKLTHAPEILIVDDNQVNLELASEILKQAGGRLTIASSGEEAIMYSHTRQFDVILMDIQMPDMDGVEATKRIREILNEATPPVIAMTAYSMHGDKERFLEQGLDDYLAKPIQPALLLAKVNQWTNGAHKMEAPLKENKHNVHTINQKTLDLLRKYAGDAVEEALVEFDNECINQLSECKLHFEQKNYKKLLEILHTLKGNASTLGIERLAQYAEKVENDLKKENYSKFMNDLSVLNSLHNEFRTEIKIDLTKQR